MQAEPAGAHASTQGVEVEFRGVSKQFVDQGQATVIENLSLVVPAGEVCVLVGPSGCGKTTSLRMVNRLVEPTSGAVLIDGSDVARQDVVQLRRGIGYVIQQAGLFPHQSIADNVATVPRLLGWPAARIHERVDELLTLVGLDPFLVRRRYPSQLSGGERQRVGVARALAAEPPVMLMDEPFGAVDPVVRLRLQDEFLRIQRRLGLTVLFVTHDIDEAIKMGTKVAVMAVGGRLEQYSSPVELLTRPASDYVARFVGSDRLLKRLGLLTVRDVPLDPIRDDAGLHQPRFGGDSSLRDVLPELIGSPERRGAVVDETGTPIGVLTMDAIGQIVRSEAEKRAEADERAEAEERGPRRSQEDDGR